ncbi:MAG: hydrolase TatD [Candidatus Omnitrophota bacterium]|nr:MAG: hydrolase TatD [Candidatus Omnitrophota bacterium]
MENFPHTRLADTHCHLDFPDFDRDREEVVQRCQTEGIDFVINVGSSLKGCRDSVELAGKYAFIYASVGIHPHEADNFNQEIKTEVKRLAGADKVVAIGETGLDYYRNLSRPENQKALFISMISLAKELDLPLIIHNRQAQDDTLKLLKDSMPVKAVVHCFSGDEQFLKDCLDLGFFISFTCNLTYKKAQNLKNLAKITPLEKLFLETDAPFLPPEGWRGKRNEPIYVKKLAEELALLKGVSFEQIAEVTTQNARHFFNLT